MAGIPRFNAQIQEVSIPQMRNFEYEQNRSIYETLKKAGERISNTFFEMLAQGKIGGPERDKTLFEREKEGRQISNLDNQNLLR